MKRWRYGLGVILLFTSSSVTALAELPSSVRVQLFSAHPNLQAFIIKGPIQVVQPVATALPGGNYQLEAKQGAIQLCRVAGKKTCFLRASRIQFKATPGHPVKIQVRTLPERHYPGMVFATIDPTGHLRLSNQVPTPVYVALVIASETLPGWPKEALKAQAVLTQTRLSRYRAGDELLDSTQQEAYLGLTHQNPMARQAVSGVWGRILTYQGRPITPFYHASCAGQTSDGRFLNAAHPVPWLTGVRCASCRQAPFFRPTITTISKGAFQRHFPQGVPQRIQADAAGRPLRFKVGSSYWSGYDLWLRLGQQFGWDKAPGTRFSITRLPDGNYQVRSTGAGHGMGLCQWGAAGLARTGHDYRYILRAYFPKAHLSPTH